jgi:hypothetical protein
MGTHATAIFVRLSDIVGANADEPAIANLELAMELHESFRLSAVLGTETAAAEDQNHGIGSLQFRELSAFCGMVGKLVVGEKCAWNDVRSHVRFLDSWMSGAWLGFND